MASETYDALKLENQLCFPLYAASREVVKHYRPFLAPLGITYTQYLVLMVLWEYGTASAKELGKRLLLDSGTLTPVLKSLEQKGLVTRFRSDQDERVLIVELTDKGDKLRDKALGVPSGIASCIQIDAGEAAELKRLLDKLLAAYAD